MIKEIIIILLLLSRRQTDKNKIKKLFWIKNIAIIDFKALKSTERKDLLNYFMIKSVNMLIILLN